MSEPVETLTPSGIAIRFTEYPRRYDLMVPDMELDWLQVPGVTTILRILDKPALAWWHFKNGAEGVVDLIDRWGWKEDGLPDTLTKQKVVEWLKREKLTSYAKSKAAGARGVGAHTALERFVKDGEIPDPRGFPPQDRGFVGALKNWLEQAKPELVLAELIVGSREHLYAGRFDLLCRINGEIWMLDLKTSESPRVYDEALIQLAAYAGCMDECGYPVPERKAIVCVGANGEFVVKESFATHEHFLGILAAYRAVESVKALHKERTDSTGGRNGNDDREHAHQGSLSPVGSQGRPDRGTGEAADA